MRKLCKELNERFLCPMESDALEVTLTGTQVCCMCEAEESAVSRYFPAAVRLSRWKKHPQQEKCHPSSNRRSFDRRAHGLLNPRPRSFAGASLRREAGGDRVPGRGNVCASKGESEKRARGESRTGLRTCLAAIPHPCSGFLVAGVSRVGFSTCRWRGVRDGVPTRSAWRFFFFFRRVGRSRRASPPCCPLIASSNSPSCPPSTVPLVPGCVVVVPRSFLRCRLWSTRDAHETDDPDRTSIFEAA